MGTAPVQADQAREQAQALAAQGQEAAVPGGEAPSGEVEPGEPKVEAGQPVPVILIWEGIGNLHKGFFGEPAATTALSVGLAGTLQPPANIYVRHDNKEYIGSVRLRLLPDTLRLPVGRTGDLLSLQDLSPVMQALASYRTDIAQRFDMRIASFSVGIESFRGGTSCIFGVTGEAPADGRVVDPCVVVNGQTRCGQPERGGVRFEPEVAKAIASCLDL